MNRRGFLKGLVGAVAGAALAEKLSTRSIFLPPRGGWLQTGYVFAYQSHQYQTHIQWGKPDIANAGVPQFLTNYVDPKILEVLIKSIGETDTQFVRRLLSRSNRK